MSNTAIKVENLSKIYRLGEIGTGTISRDMERWFKTKVLKQEDPFLKIGETNDRANKGMSDIVYSLQDINFEINQGDAVGIIGRNGAGKSTLLKILSRVTTPTTGKINIKGRVASLLEVGTGFHPELTGRENIYLNGAILGMRKREIDRKLDEIIDFSGVERYIDTPVKRYSSGMYVRLAFAVAAHLESEILIVDEVLAVGDAEFQKKCLGKMGEVSKGEGRTVLFVSHNMGAVKSLCGEILILKNGLLDFTGNINDGIAAYELKAEETVLSRTLNFISDDFEIISANLKALGRDASEDLDEYDTIVISCKLDIKTNPSFYHITFVLKDFAGQPIFTFTHISSGVELKLGVNNLSCMLPEGYLNIGQFSLDLYIIQNGESTVFLEKDIIVFEIKQGQRPIGSWMGKEPGLIKPKFNWTNNSI
jgi:lipopolysaccharide transport system ATP-binding protein